MLSLYDQNGMLGTVATGQTMIDLIVWLRESEDTREFGEEMAVVDDSGYEENGVDRIRKTRDAIRERLKTSPPADEDLRRSLEDLAELMTEAVGIAILSDGTLVDELPELEDKEEIIDVSEEEIDEMLGIEPEET